MPNLNRIMLMGHVGRDPETRFTQSGQTCANFSLATSEKWTAQDGSKKERTDWHNIAAFGRVAAVVGEFVKKGDPLYVEGRMQYREWEDKNGNKRITAEVNASNVQLLRGRDGATRPAARPAPAATETTDPDDIPF
jgi:single-strand DNA-binding protein